MGCARVAVTQGMRPVLGQWARSGRRQPWWCVFLVVLSVAGLQAAEGLRIIPLVRGSSVLVTFELTDGFTDQVKDAIRSGLKTTFTYNVELRLDVPAWVDRTIAATVVTNSVEYDNLTRQATLTRTLDGRVEKSDVTNDEAVVREWMTAFHQLPLFKTSVLEANREYYVRVVATARPTNGVLLWPWGSGTSGQAKFTFLR